MISHNPVPQRQQSPESYCPLLRSIQNAAYAHHSKPSSGDDMTMDKKTPTTQQKEQRRQDSNCKAASYVNKDISSMTSHSSISIPSQTCILLARRNKYRDSDYAHRALKLRHRATYHTGHTFRRHVKQALSLE